MDKTFTNLESQTHLGKLTYLSSSSVISLKVRLVCVNFCGTAQAVRVCSALEWMSAAVPKCITKKEAKLLLYFCLIIY